MADRVDCNRCVHYYVTWDRDFPRGCRALGFKARELPSSLVRGSSGSECLYFRARQPARKGAPTAEG